MTAAARLRHSTPYLLVGIPVLVLAVLVAYPMLYNVNLSLRNYRTAEFVGLHNFARAFDDPTLLASLVATATYVTLAVGTEVLLGLALALFIHRTVTSAAVRTLVYLLLIIPMVTPPIAAGVIARLIYTPNYGILNPILKGLHLIDKDILWLSTAQTAMFSVLSVDIWQWMPFVFLVCYAGLQAVPLDVVEAARVDGASGWKQFRLIELPYLKSLLLLLIVFRFTDTFRVFDHVLVLTAGGPGAATEFISVYLYRIAFKFFDLSYAAAIGLYVVVV
ncbi:MAG: carbohydrate ABC transporter permease, partial [Gammaproteobacteria bacterium]